LGSGTLKHQLERVINDLCVSKQVYVHEQIEPNGVARFLVNYQTLVLPSREELWGQVVNEAYSLGLNIVVSENCGISEHIRKCEGVYICDSKLENLTSCLSSAKNHALELNVIHRKVDFTSNSFVKLLVNWINKKV
jgi:glycosyltransferase involved in cell wall biosynthesis